MNIMKIVTLLFFLSPLCAFAGGSYVGKLQPYFYNNSLYLIPVESQISNKPACATRQYIRLPDSMDSPGFGPKYSTILAAWVAKQELVISGTGNCTGEGDEIILSILPK